MITYTAPLTVNLADGDYILFRVRRYVSGSAVYDNKVRINSDGTFITLDELQEQQEYV